MARVAALPLPGLTFRSYRLNTTKFTCNPHLAKPAARHGLSLASSGHPLTGTPTAGSTLLAYIFATSPPQRPEPLTAHSPPGPGGSTYATRFRACLQRHLPPHALSLPLGVFTPFGIVVLGAPGDPLACLQSRPISARSPPPLRTIFQFVRLRIIVPGPLRFLQLAVPKTSWNQPHYAPVLQLRQ